MPQMAPSLWTIAAMFVFLMFLMFSCLNYYSCPSVRVKTSTNPGGKESLNKVTLLLLK